jgi:hypothetical protein
MDVLGNVFRDYLKQADANQTCNAVAMAEAFRDERMTKSQVKEMLYASGFETHIIQSALDLVFPQKKARKE